ncbi:MAG: helix-turn-helix domain-containing protein [Phycisphaerae bacterium]|nr:helix-turn-helix domain-containing protein [Phycisphaerae bacterium]
MKVGGSTEGAKRPADLILTLNELAEYLRLARSTAYKLAQEGKIPGQKVGRHWRFRKDAIDRWLDRGERGSA